MGKVPGAPGRRSRPPQTEPARRQPPVTTLVGHKAVDAFDLSSVVCRSQHDLCTFLLHCCGHQHGSVQQQLASVELFQYGKMSWQQHRALVDTPTDCQPSPIFCPSRPTVTCCKPLTLGSTLAFLLYTGDSVLLDWQHTP